MQEKDIYEAKELLNIKKELAWSINFIKDENKVDITIHHQAIPIRAGVLNDLLHKEHEHIKRRLKSLGVTEIM